MVKIEIHGEYTDYEDAETGATCYGDVGAIVQSSIDGIGFPVVVEYVFSHIEENNDQQKFRHLIITAASRPGFYEDGIQRVLEILAAAGIDIPIIVQNAPGVLYTPEDLRNLVERRKRTAP